MMSSTERAKIYISVYQLGQKQVANRYSSSAQGNFHSFWHGLYQFCQATHVLILLTQLVQFGLKRLSFNFMEYGIAMGKSPEHN